MATATSAVLFLLGLILTVRAFRTPVQSTPPIPSASIKSSGVTIKLFAALLLYVVGLEIGEGTTSYFIVSIAFFMLCSIILMPRLFQRRVDLAITFVSACALCGLIGWGFSEVLHVSLP